MAYPRGSCHCAPMRVQGRRVVKPHAAIHAFLGFGGPCLGTERSGFSCFGLCGVSAVVVLSWQPRRENLLKAECRLTPAHGLSVLCRRRQLGATGSVQGQRALRVGNVGLE